MPFRAGLLYNHLYDYRKELKDYESVLKLYKNNLEALEQYAEFYFKDSNYLKSVEIYNRLFSVNKDSAKRDDLLVKRGLAYRKSSDYNNAIKDFTRNSE